MENRKQKVLFFIAVGLLWFSLYAYSPILSTYCTDLGASYTLAGTILSSYGFVQLVLRIPTGMLADYTGKRKLIMVAGMSFSLISAVMFMIVRNPVLLIVCRALAGMSASTWAIYMISFSSLFNKEDSKKAVGIANSANLTGVMIATFLGGIIAQWFGDVYTFVPSIASALIAIIMILFFIKEPEVNTDKKVKLRDFAYLLKDRNLIFYSVMAVFFQIAMYTGPLGFVTNILKDLGASSFMRGLATTLSSLPAICTAALSGSFFSEKLGNKLSIIIGFVITGISIAGMAISSSIALVIVFLFINGIAKGLLLSLLNSLAISNVDYSLKSTAASFFQSVYGIGMTIGPVVAGAISDAFGMNTAFISIGLFMLVPVILVAVYRHQEKL